MAPGMLNPFQKIFNWFCPYSLEKSPSAQFSSVMSDSATLWTAARQASLSGSTNSRNLLKLVHRVGDAIQPSHPLLSPSPPTFNLSQHQGFFQ